jgi:hypothetical protein
MTPDVTAELELNVEPGRAAVFLDDKYIGHDLALYLAKVCCRRCA